jgi:hypothetical protein
MIRVRKILAVVGLTIAALFFCSTTASSAALPDPETTLGPGAAATIPDPSKSNPSLQTTPQGSTVSNPGVLEEFGPPGVLITTILTGILMISRSINEGKKIDVTTYKERATDAETRANEEIGKVHKKLQELEAKLDEVIMDRDEYRNSLEERKAHWTDQFLSLEKRHQQELESVHAALMVEVHTRHKLERILAENGIQIPETPPPYTRAMKEEVTPQERAEADQAVIDTGRIPKIDGPLG